MGTKNDLCIIALSTATRNGSAALCAPGSSKIVVDHFPEGLAHGREATPRLQGLLQSQGLSPSSLDLVAVDQGPGSYTGIRVGVATATALAFACEARVVGVPSLDLLAHGCPVTSDSLAVILDARRSQVHLGLYVQEEGSDPRRWTRTHPLEALDLEEARTRIPSSATLVGDGVSLLSPIRDEWKVADPALSIPSARILLDLGRRLQAEGKDQSPEEVRPLYLRPSEAELALRRRTSSPGK